MTKRIAVGDHVEVSGGDYRFTVPGSRGFITKVSPFSDHVWVRFYKVKGDWPSTENFRIRTSCLKWLKDAEVKSPKAVMKHLVRNNYKVDSYGSWFSPEGKPFFAAGMWKYCGQNPNRKYIWSEEWLSLK